MGLALICCCFGTLHRAPGVGYEEQKDKAWKLEDHVRTVSSVTLLADEDSGGVLLCVHVCILGWHEDAHF